ncbi:ARF GTPase-activating protein GIT1 [Salmo salar]|uniref:ARF GTPase-activating protein GIT1 n=1 Tax=Salmo salar TaxID=8030 RepID=A0ABM3FAR4_SALSA|nr:ARF GTPase-activating protein GIT1 [Salmo salar]
MSRKVHRTEVCADCSAPDPGWTSINRGVLICDECCSVHRSLGRHISIVKHLRHSGWPPALLQMVQTLASNGANSIWEHSLLDPAQVQSGRRKPNPQDKVHPTKSEFIRSKYQMLSFVHKLPCRDDDGVTTKDLSKQLHSSVRTGSLETCLRLLSLGAQANFFHPEKGTTPLHVAAKAGQVLQAELLVVYGADPGALDINGRTPMDYARQAGQVELAERLVECQYELTDRLAFYLCGRRPDHKNGHYIIPQMADSSLDLSELAKAAKKKLQALNNRLFEELAMDVYDEVDRRENDAVWLTTQNHSTLVTERSAVPFLPVNPEYSATRNQGRQKLARFNAREFATLIIDILSDAKRRQQGKGLSSPTDSSLDLGADDDQHDYDSVASDEDTDSELTTQNNNNTQRNNRAKSMDSSDLSDGPITLQEYLEVKKALASSEAKVQQLMKVPKGEKHGSGTDSDYDNTPDCVRPTVGGAAVKRRAGGSRRSGVGVRGGEPDPTLPCTEDVILKTEQVTKNIQELLRAAQEFKHDSFVPCSEKIHSAVTEMASLFPKRPALDAVHCSLRLLASSASRLQVECRKAAPPDPSAPAVDYQLLTQQVIQCAYDIAKAAKQLVTITTREKKQ